MSEMELGNLVHLMMQDKPCIPSLFFFLFLISLLFLDFDRILSLSFFFFGFILFNSFYFPVLVFFAKSCCFYYIPDTFVNKSLQS